MIDKSKSVYGVVRGVVWCVVCVCGVACVVCVVYVVCAVCVCVRVCVGGGITDDSGVVILMLSCGDACV